MTTAQPGQEQRMETAQAILRKHAQSPLDVVGGYFRYSTALAAVAEALVARPTADLGEDGELEARLQTHIDDLERDGASNTQRLSFDDLCAIADRLILYREALERACAKIDDAVPYGCCDEELVAIRALLSRSGDD